MNCQGNVREFHIVWRVVSVDVALLIVLSGDTDYTDRCGEAA